MNGLVVICFCCAGKMDSGQGNNQAAQVVGTCRFRVIVELKALLHGTCLITSFMCYLTNPIKTMVNQYCALDIWTYNLPIHCVIGKCYLFLLYYV